MKFIKTLKNLKNKITTAFLMLVITSQNVLANSDAEGRLKKLIDAPSKGNGSGFMETFKNYAYDAITLIGLGVSAIAVYKVAEAGLTTYSDIQAGKKSWSDLAIVVVVGIILIVLVAYLATKSMEILG